MDLLEPSFATNWKRFKRRYRPWRTVSYGDIRVYFRSTLMAADPGSAKITSHFFKRAGCPKQQRVFEWCAGPAFIGFSLLANGLCDVVCVAEI